MNQVMEKARTETAVPVQHHPFLALRHEMDSLFDRFFMDRKFASWPESLFGEMARMPDEIMVSPDIDVEESDGAIVISAELPGLEDKDIELFVQDGVLTLKGEKRREKFEGKGKKARVVERQYGRFERAFTLPPRVDANKASAEFKKGVLMITLPKREFAEAKARTIKIK